MNTNINKWKSKHDKAFIKHNKTLLYDNMQLICVSNQLKLGGKGHLIE